LVLVPGASLGETLGKCAQSAVVVPTNVVMGLLSRLVLVLLDCSGHFTCPISLGIYKKKHMRSTPCYCVRGEARGQRQAGRQAHHFTIREAVLYLNISKRHHGKCNG